jgi:hypothetical protein
MKKATLYLECSIYELIGDILTSYIFITVTILEWL